MRLYDPYDILEAVIGLTVIFGFAYVCAVVFL